MYYPISNSLASLFFLFFLSSTSAFNITKILTQHPDLRTYNDFLIQTQLAHQINDLQIATVLVVDNGAMSTISNRPTDVIKKVLSLHVVLDYYDVQKFQHLPNHTATLTTLFQSSGEASGQQGYLNATDVSTGGVSIAWGAGSGVGANVVKAVVSQPYNLSVVQISTLIIPSTIINNSSSGSGSGAPPPAAAASPPEWARPPRKAGAPFSHADSPEYIPPADRTDNSATAPACVRCHVLIFMLSLFLIFLV